MNTPLFSHKTIALFLAIGLTLSFSAACVPVNQTGGATQSTQEGEHQEGEHQEGETHQEGDHHEEGEVHERVPNDGAVVQLVSPKDGDSFKKGDEIVVEISTENFTLGEEGRHWELYLDGNPYSSVEGGNQSEVLRGIEAGEHEIGVFLSLDTHQQLQDGASIQITVTE